VISKFVSCLAGAGAMALYFCFNHAFCASGMPEIWVGMIDANTNDAHRGIADFDALFAPGWDQDPARNSINVFKFYPSSLAKMPAAKLQHALQVLTQNHVKIALEAPMLAAQRICGIDYKGDAGQWTIDILRRVKQLGFTVDYLAMNEPFLHAFRIGQQACLGSIAVAAADGIAPTINASMQIFPNIVVGDTEAVCGDSPMQPYMAALPEWIAAYGRRFGQKLAFFHADIDWNRPHWLDGVLREAPVLQRSHIAFGLIYNGVDTDRSAQQWVAHGIDHYRVYEATAASLPHAVIFQSWADFPTRFFPASSDESLAGLMSAYFQDHRSK
jgi:hypothetical protein